MELDVHSNRAHTHVPVRWHVCWVSRTVLVPREDFVAPQVNSRTFVQD